MHSQGPPSPISSPRSPPVSALVVPQPRDVLADDVRSQRLWLALQRRAWRSLAVVAASKEIETVAIANDLAKVAWWFTGRPSLVFDMRDLTLRLLDHQLREMTSHVHNADRVFVALRAATENPTTSAIARATDAAVLCVALGETGAKAALQTLEAIGRDRFIGAILVSGSTDVDIDLASWDDTASPGRGG
jgi:hypothetical protein